LREGPTFDELEPLSRPEAPIDGLTDAQWARRVARRERAWRAGIGAVLGFLVGIVGVWPWMFGARTRMAAVLVIVGAVVLIAALLARRRDHEAMEAAGWILLPEWKLVERLPWWAVALAWFAGATLLVILAAAIVAGRVPLGG
jgi:hypothetical protein